jgi:hypothetical protein
MSDIDVIAACEHVIRVVRALYSGRRGVHLHVDLEPVRISDLKGAALCVAELLGIADVVDKHALGDWRRMARVPGSYHGSTGNECILLNLATDAELMHQLSKLLAGKFATRGRSYTVPMPRETREAVAVLGEPPPCISFLAGQLLAGQDLTHQARLHLGAYLMRIGLTPGEAAVLYSRLPDYSEHTTLYQLEWLREHDYRMYSCAKARLYGLCPLPVEGCKYYPSPNWWF